MVSVGTLNGDFPYTEVLEIVLRVWNDLQIFGSITLPTLYLIDENGGMHKTILYAVFQEAIYCQG